MAEEDRSLRSLIIEYLVAHTQCSGCGNRYHPDDMRIRAHRGHVWLAAVTCSHCGLQGLIMAAIRIRDAHEGEPAPALDAEELASLQMEPIGSDEVLDFHGFLEGFRGDVHQLFGKRDRPE